MEWVDHAPTSKYVRAIYFYLIFWLRVGHLDSAHCTTLTSREGELDRIDRWNWQDAAMVGMRARKTESRQDRPQIESAIKLLGQAVKLVSC